MITNSGTTRKIDDVGRLVIPKAARQSLNLKEGEEMEFLVNEKDRYFVVRPVVKENPVAALLEAVEEFTRKAERSEDQNLKNISRELKKVFKNVLTEDDDSDII